MSVPESVALKEFRIATTFLVNLNVENLGIPKFSLKEKFMKKRFAYFLFSLVLPCYCVSCSNSETVTPIQPGEEIFISSAHKGDVPIGEVFSEWRYVPLETTDESLLRGDERIRRLKISEDEKIYLTDGDILLRFQADGRFDYCFDNRGEGPEEYYCIWNFDFWDKDQIVITDIYHGNVVTYTTDDQFVSKFNYLDWDIADLTQFDDSLLLIRSFDSKGNRYRCHLVNKYTGEMENAYWWVDNREAGFAMKDFMYKYDGKILYHGYKYNDIYEFKRDTAIVRYTINVDNKMPPKDFWEGENTREKSVFLDYDNLGYIGHIPFYVESDHSILLFFDGGKKEDENYAFINKENRETKVIERFIFEDGFVHKPPTLYSQQDGWCAFLLYPEDILLNATFAQRFPGLEEESNPVLFIGKIK